MSEDSKEKTKENIQGYQESSSVFENEQMMNEFYDKSNSFRRSFEEKPKDVYFNIDSVNTSKSAQSHYTIFSDCFFELPIYILCSTCNEYFDIKSLNLLSINIECKCKLEKNCSLNKFAEIQKDKDFSKHNNFGCKEHGENGSFKKFIKYCKDCKKDLCELCLKESAIYNNDTGNHKTHETHYLIDLLNNDKDIEETRNLINSLNFEKSEETEDSEKSSSSENDEDPAIRKLILSLLDNYKNRPSYYGYKAIKIAKKFLSKPSNQQIDKNLKYEKLIKINSIKELKEKINQSKSIYKIIINGKDTNDEMFDLDIFKDKDFSKLKILQMNNVKKLTEINALASCSFPELKKLIIGCANLDDKRIKVIKNLKLPKIKFISFFGNKITSPEIFGAIEKFDTLEKFYIGSNKIDINKLPNKNIIYNFPKNLIELGISNMFDKTNNSFITEHLNLENIKLLFISSNEITSLKSFEKIKFNQLEEFWVRGNEKEGECLKSIEDIKYLQGKETIKKIVVKQNRIKDIEKLVDIIFLFPNLELFIIEDNDIGKEKMELIIKKIREKGGMEKLKFKYN